MVERTARVAAPVALALFVVAGVVAVKRPTEVAISVAGVAVVTAVLLAWRQLSGWPLVAGLAVCVVALLVLGNHQSSNLAWMGLCVVVGWITLTSTVTVAVVAGALVMSIPLAQWFLEPSEPGWAAWTVGVVFTVAACSVARRERILLDQLREAQAGLADQARAEERNRIAREMHDVIGHALTVSLLHISGARLSLDEDLADARASLAEAERLAQRSLAEVRASVGLLRSETGEVAPMPGGCDVPALVEPLRRAGTPVELEIVGDLGSIGAACGLAVYRIVQESLTNVARHAPGSTTAVRIEVGEEGTTVTVSSAARPVSDVREGRGIVGMRERAEALGGRLLAGPWQAGWRVEAVLPS